MSLWLERKDFPLNGLHVSVHISLLLYTQTVVMTLAVVAGYTLAWLPLNTFHLVQSIMPSVMESDSPTYIQRISYIFFTTHFLAMAHTTYNPLIYAWINVRFRSAFKAVLSKVHCPCSRLLCRTINNQRFPSRCPPRHSRNTTETSLGYTASLSIRGRSTHLNGSAAHRTCPPASRLVSKTSPIWT